MSIEDFQSCPILAYILVDLVATPSGSNKVANNAAATTAQSDNYPQCSFSVANIMAFPPNTDRTASMPAARSISGIKPHESHPAAGYSTPIRSTRSSDILVTSSRTVKVANCISISIFHMGHMHPVHYQQSLDAILQPSATCHPRATAGREESPVSRP